MKTTRSRRGFSMVEVLVVLGLLSLFLALLLPSIHSSRVAARKVSCLSNLRQIGLALQSYASAHGGFPPGVTEPPIVPDIRAADAPPVFKNFYSSYGWATRLLPDLDQASLYDVLNISRRTLEELVEKPSETRILLSMPLPIFRCPLDVAGETMETAPLPPASRYLNRTFRVDTTDPIFGGTSSYVGCAGIYDPRFPTGPLPRGQNNGILYVGSFTRDVDITDGMSNTIIVGERAYFQGSATWVGSANTRGEFEGGPGSCLGRTYWIVNAIPENPGVLVEPGDGQIVQGAWTARSGFSSYHEGGANFLFADGSVRFISDMIDSRVSEKPGVSPPQGDAVAQGYDVDLESLGVYQRLGIRNDDQPPGQF